MTLREFLVRIGIKFDKKGAKSADASVAKLKKAALQLVAAFGAIRAFNFIRRTALEMAALGDRIDKVSDKLGVSAQALQEFRFAAALTGVEQRTLDLALQRFTRRAAEAADGTGEAKATLDAMGIQLRDTNGVLRPTADLLGDVADKMADMKGDGERLAAGFKLFDSEGAGLVVTLKGGRAALEAMRQEAQDLGGVLSDQDVKAAREFTDTMTKMRFAFRSIQLAISKAILPLFKRLAEETTGLIKASRGFIKLAFVEVLGRIVRVAGAYVQAVIQVLRMVFEWIRAQDKLVQGIAAATLGLLAFMSLFFLANAPLILLLALLGLIIDDLLTFQRDGKSAIGGFIDSIDDLLHSLGALGDTIRLTAGSALDLLAGVKETLFSLLIFIETLFTKGWDKAWAGLFDNVGTAFGEMIDKLIGRFVQFSNALQTLLPPGLRIGKISVEQVQELLGRGPVAAAVPQTGGPRVMNNLEVNVTGSPGMDEQALANAAGRALSEALDTQNRNALDALTPGRPTAFQ